MTGLASIHEPTPAPESGNSPIAVRRHWLIHEVAQQLNSHGDHQSGDCIVVGVSGGADSVALLLAMAVLHQRVVHGSIPFLRPVAVHVHHHLRRTADDDAALVQRLCASLHIDLHVAHVHPANEPGNRSAAARNMRYAALAEHAHNVGTRLVAVAHHADDQFETILMALSRGAAMSGLAGMSVVRELTDEVQLIRPLLNAHRADCQELCRLAGVQWVDDPTNADVSLRRARLRRDVIPVLTQLWPQAPRRAAAAAQLLGAAGAALERELQRSFGPADQHQWPRATLAALDLPIVMAGLHRAALHLAPHVADRLGQRQLLVAARAIDASDGNNRRFDWPGGLTLRVNSDRVSLEHDAPR